MLRPVSVKWMGKVLGRGIFLCGVVLGGILVGGSAQADTWDGGYPSADAACRTKIDETGAFMFSRAIVQGHVAHCFTKAKDGEGGEFDDSAVLRDETPQEGPSAKSDTGSQPTASGGGPAGPKSPPAADKGGCGGGQGPKVVNLGGEGEVAGAINFNDLSGYPEAKREQKRQDILKKGCLIEASFTEPWTMFKEQEVDSVVGNRMPNVFGGPLKTMFGEAYRTLKSGGTIQVWATQQTDQGRQSWLTELQAAKFGETQIKAGKFVYGRK